jgi:hypothetical protein
MTKQNAKTVLELSFDIETDGPLPLHFSMSSLGACTLDGTQRFYRELKPVSDRFDPEYAAVHRLGRDYLKEHGMDPRQAVQEFDDWLRSFGDYDIISLVYKNGLNFDGYFAQAYYQQFLGYIRRDLKWVELDSYAMGRLNLVHRGEAPNPPLCPKLLQEFPKHHALGDSLQQAKFYLELRNGTCVA